MLFKNRFLSIFILLFVFMVNCPTKGEGNLSRFNNGNKALLDQVEAYELITSSTDSKLDAHIAGTADKHAAEHITYSGTAGGAEVETALNSLKADINNVAAGGTEHDALVTAALVDSTGEDFGAGGLATYLDGRLDKWELITASHTKYIDIDSPNLVNVKIGNLLRLAFNGLADVNYIMVGDSTRASNGAYVYAMVKPAMEGLNVTPTLSAQSGLKAEHWGASDDTVQPGYPQASDLIALIPGTGSTTIIDICLGLNDAAAHTDVEIASYIQAGVDIILASKPDVLFNLTSPNNQLANYYDLDMPSVYNLLVATGNYGYINIWENVLPLDADTTGFYIDTGHPNEYGQRLIGNYVISHLIPEDLRVVASSGIRVLTGYLSDQTVNDAIRGSGFRCEVIYQEGTAIEPLYLHKIGSSYYFFNIQSGNALSGAIPLVNGEQVFTTAGYLTGQHIHAIINIADATVLSDSTDTTSYFPVVNAVVTEYTPLQPLANAVSDLFADSYPVTKPVRFLKGTIDPADTNYAALASAGLRIEVHQTDGTPYTNLYIKKEANTLWYLWKATSGSNISNSLLLRPGFTMDITSGAGETVTDFEGKICIEDITALNSFSDTTAYILLKNAIVTEISPAKTIQEHLSALYDLV